jgi:N-methylhydantoinase B/acetone carboxylase, alpha subunit
LSLPGGGGFGDPRKRERKEVQADLTAGYISREQAVSDYGLED